MWWQRGVGGCLFIRQVGIVMTLLIYILGFMVGPMHIGSGSGYGVTSVRDHAS